MLSSNQNRIPNKSINFVHTLRCSLSGDAEQPGIETYTAHAFKKLGEVCRVMRLSSADGTSMSRMVASCLACQPDVADLPVGVKEACDCQAVVLNSDLSRAQQMMVCETASQQAVAANGKGGSTKTIMLMDDSTLEHAGPGSWPDVFATATAVVITASAAKKLTASDNTETAARSIQYMCRNGGYFIIDRDRLVYGSRNQVREVEMEQKELSMDQVLATCAAVAATGAILGKDTEQMAVAIQAMITVDSPTTWPLLEQRGRALIIKRDKKLARRKVIWRTARLVGTATVSSLLVAVAMLPWF